MMPFDPALAVATDYLPTAIDLRIIVAGSTANGWHSKVRGTDPDDGAAVTAAYYEIVYFKKIEATTRARELLHWVRTQRSTETAR
jgi:hypothetical protein